MRGSIPRMNYYRRNYMLDKIKIYCSALTNVVYIGRVNKNETETLEKEDRTDEVLEAARDHLYNSLKDGETKTGYQWTRKDGKVVKLMIEVCEEKS